MITNVLLLFILLHFSRSEVVDLSCEQIRSFVDGHNSRRLQVAKGQVPNHPAASDMTYMKWDPELAAKAARWASNLEYAHNPDRTIRLLIITLMGYNSGTTQKTHVLDKESSGRFGVGENVYYGRSSDLNWKLNIDSVMESWFSEYKIYKYGPMTESHFADPNNPVGHYTQMVWSDSVYVGCAVSQKIENGFKFYYVFCNYGPSGNYLGQTPYKANGARDKLICGTGNCSRLYGDKC